MLSNSAMQKLMDAGAHSKTSSTTPRVWWIDGRSLECREVPIIGFWRESAIIIVHEHPQIAQGHLLFDNATDAYIAAANYQKDQIDKLTREYTGTLSAAHEVIAREKRVRAAAAKPEESA